MQDSNSDSHISKIDTKLGKASESLTKKAKHESPDENTHPESLRSIISRHNYQLLESFAKQMNCEGKVTQRHECDMNMLMLVSIATTLQKRRQM